MSSASRGRDYARLEQELQRGEYRRILQQLHEDQGIFGRFDSWADVVAFMRSGSSQDPRKDEVLRPIFRSHQRDSAPGWRTVLLVIFWPGLVSIHRRRHHWDEDAEELWQNLVWIFLQVLCRIDVTRRPNRLVQKVINDTIHDLHIEYRRNWLRSSQECPTEPERLEATAAGAEDVEMAALAARRPKQTGRLPAPKTPTRSLG